MILSDLDTVHEHDLFNYSIIYNFENQEVLFLSITAKEIAVLAGVSRGTVDRALKGRSGINEETKARILKIAEKYEYKPNIIGKALVHSGKPITIPVVLNSIGNPFFDDVKNGIFAAEKEFASYGFEIALTEFKGYDASELLRILNALPKDTKQLIVTPINHPAVEKKLQQMINSGIKVIMLSGELENVKNALYVGCDYLKSGRIAGRLVGMLSQGKANLFIVTGSAQHKGHLQRANGIKEMIEKDYPNVNLIGISENLDDDSVAYTDMCTVLEKYPQIDFVFITAGGVQGTLQAVRELSPDMRVCAFDETPVTQAAIRGGSIMAIICQQPFEQGYQAVKALFDTIIMKSEMHEKIYSELSIKVDQSL